MKLVILAAGQGKRLGCEQTLIPKVMRKALGKPLIGYILDAADFISAEDIWAVVGFRAEAVEEAFPHLNFAMQAERLGTGHAVMCAVEAMGSCDDDIMVINGDMPLFRRETLRSIIAAHKANGTDCTLVSFNAKGEIPPFGHIIRDGDGYVKQIIEHKDANDEQKQIRELNAGLYMFRGAALAAALPRLQKSAVSGEYYLTDVPAALLSAGGKTAAFVLEDENEVLGVNTESDLAAVEEALKQRNEN